MDERSDGLLHERLDRLERRGREMLTMAARASAWRRAADIAAPASIVMPVLLLSIALLVGPVAVLPAILATLVVPLVVLMFVMGVRMARFRVERRAALAQVDRSLALKDRAVVTAEFLAADRRDGFRAAALQEAAPWLDRAISAPVTVAGGAQASPRHRWAVPLLSLVLLVAALNVPPSSRARPAGQAASTLGRIAMAIGVRPVTDAADASRQAANAEVAATGASGAAAGAGGAAGTGTAAAGAGAMGKSGAASSASHAPLGQSDSGGDAGSEASGTGRSDGSGAAGRMGTASTGRQAGDPPRDRQDAEAKQGQADGATASESRATPPGGPQSSAAAGLSAAGAPPQPRSPGSNQSQPRSGARSRPQSGQQSEGANSSGRSNNGQQGSNRGNGSEGIKRARGSSSLMLAVPMEDRVIGTINAGSVSTTTRNAPPRATTSGRVAAQARGTGQGPGAPVAERTRSVQEDRLLERYFARAGVGQ